MGRHGLLSAAVRLAGWLVVPLFVASACAGYLLELRAGLWDNENQPENLALLAGFGAFAMVGSVLAIKRPANPIGWIMAAIALLSGVAHAVAVLKYRLYDIDLIVNRALVYGPLTATLAAIYFGGIVLSQRVFLLMIGQESTFAVVASTLAIAALFNPLRHRVQAFVDRRFYRKKYDAAKTLAIFNSRLREETDLDSLIDDVLGVVRETMQPAHASLWLRPHKADTKEDVPS